MVDTKKCRVCGEIDLNKLHKRANKGEYIIDSICISCFKIQRKIYYEKTKKAFNQKRRIKYRQNKTEILEYNKCWRDNNKDKVLAHIREHYKENSAKILQQQKEKYATNELFREASRKRSKQWELDNPDRLKQRYRAYYKKNRDKISKQRSRPELVAQRREYRKLQYLNNAQHRLRMDLSITINKALKRNGGSKDGYSCLSSLNYSIIDLKIHLESLFEPWMNWGNRGIYNPKTWDDNNSSTWTWQIDHIIPQSKFKYTSMTDNDFQKCWSLNNLRPYSAKRNNIERDRLANFTQI